MIPAGHRPLVLALAVLAVTGCRPRPPSLRLTRLSLDDVRPREVRGETRPAFVLPPGESRSWTVDAPPGSRLRFAWALLKRAPGRGFAELTVQAGARVLYTRRLAARAGEGGGWIPETIALEGRGGLRLTIAARHLGADGRLLPGEPGADWIAVAPPRLYTDRPASHRRVLVWISQDAVRADHVSAYGYARRTTPAFDRRAREWVLFEKAVTPASWTLPALVSHFTSRLPTRHGAVQPSLTRDRRATSLFEALAAAGFTVVGVTGNGFVSRHFGLADGFDALLRTKGSAEAHNRLALRALDEWAGGDLALFVHYMDPHADYEPPPPFDTLFDPGYRGTARGKDFQGLERRGDAADVEHVKALYDGEIAYTDAQIDALLEDLAARGLLDEAVLAYTADHGEEFLDHGGWTHGPTLYEEVLHVPFALRIPGLAPRRVSEPVSLLDVAPTVLAAVGVEAPGSFEGRNLLPLLRRGGPMAADPIVSETEYGKEDVHRIAVRDGEAKYHLTTAQGRDPEPPVLAEALYDLEADGAERSALPPSPRRERLRRHALLYLELARRGAPTARGESRAEVPPELERELKALGYVQ